MDEDDEELTEEEEEELVWRTGRSTKEWNEYHKKENEVDLGKLKDAEQELREVLKKLEALLPEDSKPDEVIPHMVQAVSDAWLSLTCYIYNRERGL